MPEKQPYNNRPLAVVEFLMLKINPHSNWNARLLALLAKHADVPQARVGFPPAWQDDPFWKAPVAGGQT
ncbi:hypothetical protein FEF65_04870 [Mariprofundus erugo]|uniref:Uncharacterized protein n=1 Tax=Mariprofundus erugo TaxID=2528639 RepID=A0A5R9GZU8_9PROT|nr:hypothetical protein [Mariprofundus erugo]TLS68324.1 hypothetical protein FEF65_04870 [Mariprofundus erugo]